MSSEASLDIKLTLMQRGALRLEEEKTYTNLSLNSCSQCVDSPNHLFNNTPECVFSSFSISENDITLTPLTPPSTAELNSTLKESKENVEPNDCGVSTENTINPLENMVVLNTALIEHSPSLLEDSVHTTEFQTHNNVNDARCIAKDFYVAQDYVIKRKVGRPKKCQSKNSGRKGRNNSTINNIDNASSNNVDTMDNLQEQFADSMVCHVPDKLIQPECLTLNSSSATDSEICHNQNQKNICESQFENGCKSQLGEPVQNGTYF